MPSSRGTDADKASLRSHHLKARAAVSPTQRDRADASIRERFCSLPEVSEASIVLTYVSYGSEVDTHGIIEGLLAEGRRVAVPRCNAAKHSMDFFEISGMEDLVAGFKGILEPAEGLVEPVSISQMVGSVCVVPGLVFDGEGRRIGYGGGYYDRFLPFYPGHKVALARTAQLSPAELPCEPTDVCVDVIVTEDATWRCA